MRFLLTYNSLSVSLGSHASSKNVIFNFPLEAILEMRSNIICSQNGSLHLDIRTLNFTLKSNENEKAQSVCLHSTVVTLDKLLRVLVLL